MAMSPNSGCRKTFNVLEADFLGVRRYPSTWWRVLRCQMHCFRARGFEEGEHCVSCFEFRQGSHHSLSVGTCQAKSPETQLATFSISLDFPDLPGGQFSQITSRREARQLGSCGMYQPPPLRGRSVFDGKKVLLIDPHQPTRDVRASVLRSRGIEVDATDSLQTARFLWRPKLYDLLLLDAHRPVPEALDFYLEVKHASPHEHVVFLIGPPTFLSLTWPNEAMATEKGPQQWAETVRRFVIAA